MTKIADLFRGKPTRVVVGVLLVLVIVLGVPVGEMAREQHRYQAQADRANSEDPKELQPLLGSAAQKQEDHSFSGMVDYIRRQKSFHAEVMVPSARRRLKLYKKIDPPLLWEKHHSERVKLELELMQRSQIELVRLEYVDQYLGDDPTLGRMALLARDPEYLRLTKGVEDAQVAVRYATKDFNESRPLFTGILWEDDYLMTSIRSQFLEQSIEVSSKAISDFPQAIGCNGVAIDVCPDHLRHFDCHACAATAQADSLAATTRERHG